MNGKRESRLHPQGRNGRWSTLQLLASVLVYLTLPCLGQATGDDLEAQVKAAFIYNFTKFIYWDREAGDARTVPITIFVRGTDPIGVLLEDFLKKQTSDLSLIVKKINAEENDISKCQLLFIGHSEKEKLPAIFRQLQGTKVLTVSDIPGFARLGGMIGFIIEKGRVKIEINQHAVSKAGLQISAKLLEVAKIVSSED
jgi:hypothetical protein